MEIVGNLDDADVVSERGGELVSEKGSASTVPCGAFEADKLPSEIKKGILGSFVFFGEEDYLKSYYRDEIYRNVMQEGMETFNYFPISFSPASSVREDPLVRLSDAVLAMPMMQDKKLVLVSDLSPSGMGKDSLDALCSAMKTATGSDDTVLILYCRADEMETDYKLESSAFYKKLATVSRMVRFDLQPRGKLIAWIKRHFVKETILISDEAAGLLSDMCAGRMTPLSFEIEKLICYAKYVKGKPDSDAPPVAIDEDDVRRIATISETDESPFAMANAAQSWKLSEMLAVLDTARAQKEEPIAVLARLSRILLDMLFIKTAKEAAMSAPEIAKAMKMKEFRVGKYLASVAKVPLSVLENAVCLAYETDRALKSAPTDPWVILDELAVKLYAPKSLRKE